MLYSLCSQKPLEDNYKIWIHKMHLKCLIFLHIFTLNAYLISGKTRTGDYTGFRVQGKMIVQRAPCLITGCYGLPEISCIALNYKPSAILISFNGSHAIGCFLTLNLRLIDLWCHKDGRCVWLKHAILFCFINTVPCIPMAPLCMLLCWGNWNFRPWTYLNV